MKILSRAVLALLLSSAAAYAQHVQTPAFTDHTSTLAVNPSWVYAQPFSTGTGSGGASGASIAAAINAALPAGAGALLGAGVSAGTTSHVSLSADFVLSGGVLVLAPTGVAAGACVKPLIDTKGRITSCIGLAMADISGPLGYVPISPAGLAVETTRASAAETSAATTAQAALTTANAALPSASAGPLATLAGASPTAAVASALGYIPYNGVANPAGFITAASAGTPVLSVNGRSGNVTLSISDIPGVAALVSPALLGVPTSPTAVAGTSTAQIATTAFDAAAVAVEASRAMTAEGRNATAAAAAQTTAGLAAPAASLGPLAALAGASPSAAIASGLGYTPYNGVANAAGYVTAAQLATASPVQSVAGRTGIVTLGIADVAGGAPLASPAFTGTPSASTALPGVVSDQLATTAFSAAGISVEASRAIAAEANLAPVASPTFTGVLTTPQLAVSGSEALSSVLAGPSAAPGTPSWRRLTSTDVTGVAPLASPALTGIPTAPTAPANANTTQLATTAFVLGQAYQTAPQAAADAPVQSVAGRTGAITLGISDVPGSAPLLSPSFTGTPTVPTASPGTSTGQAASTAFVIGQVAAATTGVSSVDGRTGAVTLSSGDVAGDAPLASPVFIGTPSAPTPAQGTNTAQIATTGFATTAINSEAARAQAAEAGAATKASPTFTGTLTAPFVALTGTQLSSAVLAGPLGGSGAPSFRALSPVDVPGVAPLASPALSGVPSAPTASAGVSTGQIATTAFATGAVASEAARAQAAEATGVSASSPALTGTPTAPTAAAGTNTTQIATTGFTSGAVATEAARATAAEAKAVPSTGGTMTGPLIVPSVALSSDGLSTVSWNQSSVSFVFARAGVVLATLGNTGLISANRLDFRLPANSQYSTF